MHEAKERTAGDCFASRQYHRVNTIPGALRFDGPSNYGEDLMHVKQIQNGKWVVVWPRNLAAPRARMTARIAEGAPDDVMQRLSIRPA